MSALSAIATGVPLRRLSRSRLELYRDDGPLGRALGAAAGPRLALPPLALVLVGFAPVAALMVAERDGASHGVALAAVAWLVVLAVVSSGRPHTDRSAWSVPGLLRVSEYATLMWIGSLASGTALPAAFALIGVLAFRHYDLVYRERFQGLAPSGWVSAMAGGWDGRLLAASALLLAGALPAGFFAAAAALGVAFAAESAASWARFRTLPVSVYEDEEDEGQ